MKKYLAQNLKSKSYNLKYLHKNAYNLKMIYIRLVIIWDNCKHINLVIKIDEE